jgi:hypothetical protein
MKEEFVTSAIARRFLLGDVDNEERQRIEGLFVSDAEANKKILLAEEDLIEEYLENSLTGPEREKFLQQYGHTPEQRRKLRIAKSIKDYALVEAKLTQSGTSTIPKWRSVLSSLRRPGLFIPVAATLMIVVVVAVVSLVGLSIRRSKENNQRAVIERELAELNSPSSRGEVPVEVSTIVLPPVSLRSVEPQTELTVRTDTRVVELHLLWIQKEEYPSYRAVLRRGGPEQITISNLHIEKESGGSAVRVKLPAHLLGRGLYLVELSGIARDGLAGLTEEYSFTVGR